MEKGKHSHTLEARLVRLERQVRGYRLGMIGLGLVAVIGLVMGASQGGVQNSVRARNFYVVDNNGNNIAVLGNSRVGTPGLWFYDNNKDFIVIEKERNGPHAIVHAKYFDVKANGKRIASLGTSKINTPGLWFYDGNNEFIVIEKEKGANAVVHASQFEIKDNEKLLGALGTSVQKNPGLWFRDSNGREFTVIGSNGTRVWLNEIDNGRIKAVLTQN